MDAEFGIQVAGVPPDGVLGQEQLLGDKGAASTLGDKLEDLELPGTEPGLCPELVAAGVDRRERIEFDVRVEVLENPRNVVRLGVDRYHRDAQQPYKHEAGGWRQRFDSGNRADERADIVAAHVHQVEEKGKSHERVQVAMLGDVAGQEPDRHPDKGRRDLEERRGPIDVGNKAGDCQGGGHNNEDELPEL